MTISTASSQTAARTALASGKHIAFIDTLRAVAAMTVLLQHIADRLIMAHVAGSEVWQAIFVSLFDAGRFGVGIFFMVSGYVVPFSIREPNAVRTFLVGRFFRLYPVYWLSLLGGYAVVTWYSQVSIPTSHLLANATMLEMAMGVPVLLGPYWTLIIELAFYAACIGIYMLGFLRSERAAWVTMGACLTLSLTLAVVGYATGMYLRANLLFNLSLMFYGLAVRHADERGSAASQRGVWLSGLLLALAASIILLIAPDRANPMFTPQSFLFGYLAAIAVFLVVRLRRPRASALVAWLAAISYPVYLFHEIFLILFEGRLTRDAGAGEQFLFAASVVVVTLIAANIAHRWLEQPAIALGRRIVARMRGKRDFALSPAEVASRVSS